MLTPKSTPTVILKLACCIAGELKFIERRKETQYDWAYVQRVSQVAFVYLIYMHMLLLKL